METTIKFLGVLGVEVIEVEDLAGKCAVWSNRTRQLSVCAKLCHQQRAEYINDVLSVLADQ